MLIGVLVLLIVGLMLVGRLRAAGRCRAAALFATAGLLIAVAVTLGLTLRPMVDPHQPFPTLYLDPREGIRAAAHLHIVWGPVIDNVALFVPIGGLASALFWRRSLTSVWLACILTSLTIETLQFLVPIGRIANSADVLANGVGAALGLAIAVLIGARRRPGPRHHDRDALPVTAA